MRDTRHLQDCQFTPITQGIMRQFFTDFLWSMWEREKVHQKIFQKLSHYPVWCVKIYLTSSMSGTPYLMKLTLHIMECNRQKTDGKFWWLTPAKQPEHLFPKLFLLCRHVLSKKTSSIQSLTKNSLNYFWGVVNFVVWCKMSQISVGSTFFKLKHLCGDKSNMKTVTT